MRELYRQQSFETVEREISSFFLALDLILTTKVWLEGVSKALARRSMVLDVR